MVMRRMGAAARQEFPGLDGPRTEYEPEYIFADMPSSEDLRTIDCAFAWASRRVFPGAPRPDELARRPADEHITFYLKVEAAANDVGNDLRPLVPPYIEVVRAVLALRADVGPRYVVLANLDELGEAGYLVFLALRGQKLEVDVRLRETGTKESLGLRALLSSGVRANEVYEAQKYHRGTPQWFFHALKRQPGANN